MVTTYFKNLVADNLWRTAGDAASDLPTAYYLALSSTEPLEDGTGVTEPVGASTYARQKLASMSVAENGVTTNTAVISWARFETDQGEIGYWALFDALVGGNLLMGGALDGVKHIDAGTTIAFENGSLTLNVLGA